MIGLAGLPDGSYVRMHPAGALYLLVRRRKIVYAELAILGERDLHRWSASVSNPVGDILAGYRALAEKVVMPAV